MKYWRGYLTAGVLGFFAWALMAFSKAHTDIIDMVYPYVTRMIQGTLAQWSGGADYLLWQAVLVLLALALLVTVVLMIVLRWNPIQWFGWVLAVASLGLLLHTGLYGLNDYAGSVAADIKLEVTDYTISELEEAAAYYRDRANTLAAMVTRDENGDVDFPEFAQMAEDTVDGFQHLTYQEHYAVFYGTAINAENYTHWTQWEPLPIKELTWEDWFSSIGVTGIHVPLTGEVAVNPQAPEVALPFIMSRETAKRLCIANEGDAEFAAYLACSSNTNRYYQYSAQLMAYVSCRDALASMPGTAAPAALARLEAEICDELRHDIDQYDAYFAENVDPGTVEKLDQAQAVLSDLWDGTRDLFGVEPLDVDTNSFYDLLVSWHIQEVVLPTQIPEEEDVKFDPYDENYINGITDMEGNPVQETDPTENIGETTGE